MKHSYIKGAKGKARAKAHVNYVAHRGGHDREQGGREFFSRDRDGISAREVKQDINQIERAPVVAHKLILSPGMPGVDVREYTREVLEAVGRSKGLDLDYRAVVHLNTANDHAHVVVFSSDLNGRRVKFDRDDYKLMKLAGDRYLEREHDLERYMQREPDLERYMQKDRQLEKVLSGGRLEMQGDDQFQRLINDVLAPKQEFDDRERKKREDETRNIDEHRRLDEELGRTFKTQDERQRSKGRETRMYENRGRLTDFHMDYQNAMEQKRLDDLAKANPEQREEIEEQVRELKEESRDRAAQGRGWKEFDALLGENWESVDKTREREQALSQDRESTKLATSTDRQTDPDGDETKASLSDDKGKEDLHLKETTAREERHFQDQHIGEEIQEKEEPEREERDDHGGSGLT